MDGILACADLGGTAIKTGVCGSNGVILEKGMLPVCLEFDMIVKEIEDYVHDLKNKYEVRGLALSAPGVVDTKNGIIGGGSAIPCIHGPSWISVMEKRLNLPVSIENDANCAALAEVTFGNAKGCENVAFIICGTGIGGAVVINGKICPGSHLYGGEFGCMVMRDEEGRLSTFSAQASTMSFVRKIQKLYPEKVWDGVSVFREAETGNRECIRAIDRFYYNLAEGIYNVQHVYDPEIVILGGGISSREDFIIRLEEKLSEITGKVERETATRVLMPRIAACAFQNDANLIGAAAHWLQQNRPGDNDL